MSTSKKMRKGGAGGGGEELMPFACVMENAQNTVPQEEGELSLDIPSDKEESTGHSDKGNATKRVETRAGDPKNFRGAGKGKAVKTDQSPLVKGKGLAESQHKNARKGEAAKETKPFVSTSKGDEGAKTLNASISTSGGAEAVKGSTPLMDVSKSAGESEEKPFPGTIATLPEKGSNGQVTAGKGGFSKGDLPKGGTAGRVRSLTGADPASLSPKVQRTVLQTETTGAETAKVAVGKSDALKETGKTRVATSAGELVGNKKGIAAAFKNAGINEGEKAENLRVTPDAQEPSRAGLKKAAAIQGKITVFQNEENGTVKNSRAAEGTPGVLTPGPKKTVTVKRNGVVEKGGTEKVAYTSASGSGKNDIGDQLGLKDETTGIGYNKTDGKKTHDHTVGVPRRETFQSTSPGERDFSAGGYQQTALHAGGRSVAPSENIGITPRALIDQVASGAKMSGRVRIALNPPNLGTLDMDVLVRDNNKVHVILQAESNDVRQILQSHMESLKGSLRSQGLVADTIQVFAQEKSDGGNYESGRNETFFGENSSNRGRNERDEGGGRDFSGHASSVSEEKIQRVRGDGRISLFA